MDSSTTLTDLALRRTVCYPAIADASALGRRQGHSGGPTSPE